MALTDSIIGYWTLDEASGDASDSTASALTLTDTNTVDTGTGKINGARDFEAGNSEALIRASESALQCGDIDFTFAAWVKTESTHTGAIVGKSNGAGVFEYMMQVVSSVPEFKINNASSSKVISSGGALSAGTWYFVVAWYDANSTNTTNIQVNNGTVDSTSYSSGALSSTGGFAIGRFGGFAVNYFDGLIDEVGFWKRVLTADERTSLYNSGNGLAYPFTTGVKQFAALGVGL